MAQVPESRNKDIMDIEDFPKEPVERKDGLPVDNTGKEGFPNGKFEREGKNLPDDPDAAAREVEKVMDPEVAEIKEAFNASQDVSENKTEAFAQFLEGLLKLLR